MIFPRTSHTAFIQWPIGKRYIIRIGSIDLKLEKDSRPNQVNGEINIKIIEWTAYFQYCYICKVNKEINFLPYISNDLNYLICGFCSEECANMFLFKIA